MSDNAGSRNAGNVEQLLREAELDDDGALRPALLELRALVADQPQPSAAVAALMVPAAHRLAAVPPAIPAALQPDTAAMPALRRAASGAGAATDELAVRRRAKRRIALTTLSVAVSLAAGGAVAAASDQGIRDSFGQLNHAVTSFVSTMGGGPANEPLTTPVPVPPRPGSSPSVPAPEAPAVPAPAATAPDATQPGTEGPQNHPAPGASGSVPLPKLPLPESIMPGVPDGLPSEVESSVPSVPAGPPVPLPSHVP